jgi:nickel/cobalt transporter (NicO) family protein
MNSLIAIQGWLYSGMASGLGEVAGGDMRAVLVAMAAAVLFGAVHAMMPGHGKTVLVSYHLGQPGKLGEGIANGAILTLTHVGLALVLVLAGFAVISRAFAQGGRTPQFELARWRRSAPSCFGVQQGTITTRTNATAGLSPS